MLLAGRFTAVLRNHTCTLMKVAILVCDKSDRPILEFRIADMNLVVRATRGCDFRKRAKTQNKANARIRAPLSICTFSTVTPATQLVDHLSPPLSLCALVN